MVERGPAPPDLACPFDRLWERVDDIETCVPTIDPLVRNMKVLSRDGDHIECKSDLFLLEGELRSGFMWMQTRRGAGERTRIAHMEGMRFGLARLLRPWFRRTVRWDLNGMERLIR